MAKYLIWLLLLGTSNVLANACYWSGSRYNADCYACLPNSGWPEWWKQQYCGAAQTCQQRVETQTLSCPTGYTGAITQNRNIMCANPYQEVINEWYTVSNTCQPTCQTETQTEVLSCPTHYTGQIVKTRTKICPQNSWTNWQTNSTCVQDPPSCQTQSQTQTLSCQTGYTGSIIQTRTSSCPDPYGQPVWQPWGTTSNSCVKSVTNPTNVASPVSPVSPVNPINQVTPVSPTPTSTATVSTSVDVQNSVTTPITSPTLPTKSTASETPTQKETPKETPKIGIKTLPLALSLELFSKPAFNQPNAFPDLNISQELPNDIKIMQQIYMDLITNGSLFNTDQTGLLNRITSDQVELEQ